MKNAENISTSRGSASTPALPSILQADHREFVQALSGLAGPERVDIHVLHLLTKFGLLVHENSDRLGPTVTLLERRERKAGFLERAVRELGLKNTRVIPSRLEDLAAGLHSPARPTQEPGFDSVFIRALSSLPELLGSLGPVCAPGARWVYFLGAGTSAEKILSGLRPLGLGAETARGKFGGQLLHGRLHA